MVIPLLDMCRQRFLLSQQFYSFQWVSQLFPVKHCIPNSCFTDFQNHVTIMWLLYVNLIIMLALHPHPST
jgi:hypothetical protein